MTKIAYNACYGGFSLSNEAILLARQISGDPKWGDAVLKGEAYGDGSICNSDWDSHHVDVPRTDPTLIKVIEQLGEKAGGMCSNLKIANLPEGTRYRIVEYDGFESVKTPDDYEWSVA